LYTDGGVPFGNEVGRSLIAHLYNSDASRHGGKVQVIYTCKQKSEGRWVEDLERGVMPGINPYPWQTDTSIGDWFYNRNWKFRPVSWTIHMLVDIVSKNGNLLLNVVQRPDGSIDADVEQMLNQLADWFAVYGEAIYGTRPWLVYGEGAVRTKGGHFHEDFNYTPGDIRFTTKGGLLYAIALGWPEDGKLTIKSLANTAQGQIKDISLLGSKAKLTWTQTSQGLVVTLPAQKLSPYTCGLRIKGTGLRPAPLVEQANIIEPDSKGELVLPADAAEIHGDKLNTEDRDGQMNLGFWDNAGEWVAWQIHLPKPGKFSVSASIATVNEGAELSIQTSQNRLVATVPATGDWGSFKTVPLGELEIAGTGGQLISLHPKDPATWKAINLRYIKLTPVN
jgi:alpha-L-fucosidase